MNPSAPHDGASPHYPEIFVSVVRGPLGRLEVRSGDEQLFACTFGQAELGRADDPSCLPASAASPLGDGQRSKILRDVGDGQRSKILRDVGAAFGRDLDSASWEAVVASDPPSGSEHPSA